MKQVRILVSVLCAVFVLTACSLDTTTDDTDEDPEAAQSFFPQLAGYNINDTDNIVDAVTTAAGGAAAMSANPVALALVERASTMIDCYQDVGAADAQTYVQRINVTEPTIPVAGVLAIVNQTRIADNFLHCLTRTPLSGAFSAQSVQPEPCYGYGTFTFNEETISFLYAATDTPLCTAFDQHFAPYNPTGDSGAIVIPDTGDGTGSRTP